LLKNKGAPNDIRAHEPQDRAAEIKFHPHNKPAAIVAPPNKSRYIPAHALFTPHFAIAFHLQPAGGAEAALARKLNPPPLSIKAGGSVGVSRG
jgi:hypothetical protein